MGGEGVLRGFLVVIRRVVVSPILRTERGAIARKRMISIWKKLI